jgi:cytochrome c oxidase assembly protein subunit 15
MAMHFGISMTCFAAVFLLTRLLYERPGEVHPLTLRAQTHPLPNFFRWGAWGMLAGSVVVAYIGAYLRHSGNELACYQWPRCDGQLVPDLSSPAGISFAHRVAALALMALVFALAYTAYRMRADYPSLFAVLGAAAGIIVLQALAGGAVVLSELDLWTTLAHAALMAWLFVFITDACRQVLKTRKLPRAVTQPLLARPSGMPGGD